MGDTHIPQDKPMDALYQFVCQDPELHSMFKRHATCNAASIMQSILSDAETAPVARQGKLTYSQVRDCIMEAAATMEQFTINDLRQHPALNGYKASILNQNLDVLHEYGKVKRTRQKVGRTWVWVKR